MQEKVDTTNKLLEKLIDGQNAVPEIGTLVADEPGDANTVVYNHVKFGTYQQNTSGEDSTSIEWLVLAYDSNKALLISCYGLDVQPYNTSFTRVAWETCTMRTWLDNTFMNKAFTEEEKKAILTTMVDNSSSQCYSGCSTNGGNNTQDQIFLLSYAEARKYFGVKYWLDDRGAVQNMKAQVTPTAYASAQGAYRSNDNKTEEGDNSGWWWLRSPGNDQSFGLTVSTDGSFYNGRVTFGNVCVRPALWVDLNADVFAP